MRKSSFPAAVTIAVTCHNCITETSHQHDITVHTDGKMCIDSKHHKDMCETETLRYLNPLDTPLNPCDFWRQATNPGRRTVTGGRISDTKYGFYTSGVNGIPQQNLWVWNGTRLCCYPHNPNLPLTSQNLTPHTTLDTATWETRIHEETCHMWQPQLFGTLMRGYGAMETHNTQKLPTDNEKIHTAIKHLPLWIQYLAAAGYTPTTHRLTSWCSNSTHEPPTPQEVREWFNAGFSEQTITENVTDPTVRIPLHVAKQTAETITQLLTANFPHMKPLDANYNAHQLACPIIRTLISHGIALQETPAWIKNHPTSPLFRIPVATFEMMNRISDEYHLPQEKPPTVQTPTQNR